MGQISDLPVAAFPEGNVLARLGLKEILGARGSLEFGHFCPPIESSLAFLYRKLCRKLCRVVDQSREPMLTHLKHKVYGKALAPGASAQELSASWGRRHAMLSRS